VSEFAVNLRVRGLMGPVRVPGWVLLIGTVLMCWPLVRVAVILGDPERPNRLPP